MGKSDQKKTQHEISRSADAMYGQTGQGINDASSRVAGLTKRSDAERGDVLSKYGDMYRTGGVDPDLEARIKSLYGSFTDSKGGFDPKRLSDIEGDASALREFARTGGVSAADEARIYDPTLQEFSKTGGYTPEDIANIHSRSNSTVASTYGNLKNDLELSKLRGGGVGPGWSEAGFKLARRGAQDMGTNARDTEIGINDSVRTGRMSAADILSQRALGLSGLKSNNTLAGYKGASDIGLNTQELINRNRQFGGSGLSDLAGLKQRGTISGANGLADMYRAAPGELTHEEDLLRGYRQDQQRGSTDLINDRIGASKIPGIGSTISSGIGIASQIAGMAAGGIPGLMNRGITGGRLPRRATTPSYSATPYGNSGSQIVY